MINQLTAEQEAMLPVYKDRWLKIGLSTEDCDRDKAEDACRRAYKVAGFAPPNAILWAECPVSAAVMAALIKNKDQVRAQVWEQVWEQVGELVWAQVLDQVRAQVGEQVRAQVLEQVWAQVRAQVGAQVLEQVGAQVGAQVLEQVRAQVLEQVWAQVRAQVGAQVGAQVRAQVLEQVRAQVGAQVGGCHAAGWFSFYSFFLEVLELKCCEPLAPLMDLAENCGWWAPYEGVAILQEKPKSIHMVDGKLHNPLGPSITYRSGLLDVYSLYGVRVTKEIVEMVQKPDQGQAIMAIENAEHRLVAIKTYGVENLLSELGANHVYCDEGLLTVHRALPLY